MIDNYSETIDGDALEGLAATTEVVAALQQARGINNKGRGLRGGIRDIGIDNDDRCVSRGRGRDDAAKVSVATTEAAAGQ